VNKATIVRAAKFLGTWAPALFLAYIFFVQGAAKFSDTSGWARAFQHWGYPDWFRYTIGFAEILAATLLLWGRTAPVGAMLVIALMLGGVGTHVVAGDRHFMRSEMGPILFASIVLFARRAELRRVLTWRTRGGSSKTLASV
jgi:uncharacterized membrane protein YphA (DoxX/SURF4 family)